MNRIVARGLIEEALRGKKIAVIAYGPGDQEGAFTKVRQTLNIMGLPKSLKRTFHASGQMYVEFFEGYIQFYTVSAPESWRGLAPDLVYCTFRPGPLETRYISPLISSKPGAELMTQ